MPSRRTALAAFGVAGGTLLGATAMADGRIDVDRSGGPDWPAPRFDAAGTAASPVASGPGTNPAVRWQAELNVGHRPSPILVGDTVFVAASDGIVAVDRDTGRVLYEREGGPFVSAPAWVETDAYDREALAVRGRTGLYGFDAGGGYDLGGLTIGFQRWETTASASNGRLPHPQEQPFVTASSGTVYVPDAGRVVAVDANSGRIRWEQSSDDQQFGTVHRPAVFDGTVYVSEWPQRVYAIDAATGRRQWSAAIDGGAGESGVGYRAFGGPTVTESAVVVLCRDTVICFDRADGSRRWIHRHDGNVTEGATAVAGGTVFTPGDEGRLHAIDLETGDVLWRADHGEGMAPVVANGVVYRSNPWSSVLVAIDVATGEHRWSYDFESPVSRPAVGDGVVYVTDGGGITALEGGERDG